MKSLLASSNWQHISCSLCIMYSYIDYLLPQEDDVHQHVQFSIKLYTPVNCVTTIYCSVFVRCKYVNLLCTGWFKKLATKYLSQNVDLFSKSFH